VRHRELQFVLASIASLGLVFGCGDSAPLAFDAIAASPDPAKTGDTLTITFTASKPLAANPTVTVDGNTATFVSEAALSYTYSYVVAGTETEGAATIAVSGDGVSGGGVFGDGLFGDSSSGSGSVVLDFTAPLVGVDTLSTWDTTPAVTGSVDDPTAAVTVTVDGQMNAATNWGDGTWTLADNTLTALAPDTYDVAAQATDAVGNIGTDATTDELKIFGLADIGTGMTGVRDCSLAWGDYDGDGDLDLALAGTEDIDNHTYLTKIYRNNGGAFTDIDAGLTPVGEQCSLAWGDYDGDGDLDLAVAGREDFIGCNCLPHQAAANVG